MFAGTTARQPLVDLKASLAVFRIDRHAIVFAVWTTGSALAALTIATWFGFHDAYWAAVTSWVLALPGRGMLLVKALFRVIGTLLRAWESGLYDLFGRAEIAHAAGRLTADAARRCLLALDMGLAILALRAIAADLSDNPGSRRIASALERLPFGDHIAETAATARQTATAFAAHADQTASDTDVIAASIMSELARSLGEWARASVVHSPADPIAAHSRQDPDRNAPCPTPTASRERREGHQPPPFNGRSQIGG